MSDSTLTNKNDSTLVQPTEIPQKPNFQEVYTQYYRRILRYIQARTNSLEIAEDLTGKVFLKALENYRRFRMKEGPESPRFWLFRIAHNIVVSWKRKNVIRFIRLDEIDLHIPDNLVDIIEKKVKRTWLLQAIKNLISGQQLVIALIIFFGFKLKQIAKILDVTEGCVKTRKHKAITVLKLAVSADRLDNNENNRGTLSIIDVIEAAKYVLDSGLPQISAPLHQVFSLEVTKTLEERGYRFSDILKVLSSLPEDFFKEIIEENPYTLEI